MAKETITKADKWFWVSGFVVMAFVIWMVNELAHPRFWYLCLVGGLFLLVLVIANWIKKKEKEEDNAFSEKRGQ